MNALASSPIAQFIASDWYVIRTRTGHEENAEAILKSLGAETWRPTYRTRTKPTKKRKPIDVERELFPSYVLAANMHGLWHRIAEREAIIGWVAGLDGRPLSVHPNRVHQLQSIAERQRIGQFDDAGIEGRLMPGDMLEILFGAFAGYRMAFIGINAQMIEGEIEMLGAKRKVKIPHAEIRLAK